MYLLLAMIKCFGKSRPIEINFGGICSSVKMLKGCMVRERLGTPALVVRHKLNQIDSDMIFSRSCNQGKIAKKKLKDNYGCLIDLLNQISKLSHFNRLNLSDFLIHNWFPFCVLMWQPWVCAITACNMSII